jgi:release factor glutamine methyltransferase
VEAALDYLGDKKALVLELGTGSGAVAAALATERPQWQIIATDRQLDTLDIARKNFSRNALQVESIVSNWFENVPDMQFDLIISNPPYIAANDPHLQQGDLRFEPLAALASGTDGLNDIRTITRSSRKYLQPDGYLMLEHGFNQAPEVQQLFLQAGLRNIHTLKDLAEQSRITLGQR